MSKRLALVVLTAAALATASFPCRAQGAGVRPSPRAAAGPRSPESRFQPPATNLHQHGFGDHRFGHHRGFGGGFPVIGLGFDSHHFHLINRFRSLNADFHIGFFGGGFFGNGLVAGSFFPVVNPAPTVIVVPQPAPVVVQTLLPAGRDVVVPLGLPDNWSQVRIVKPSYAADPQPLPQLTLLVLRDQTIYAATDYWLEDGRIFFVTSAGQENSVAVRDLDWEMTTRLNTERRVTFVLRSGR